MTTPLGLEFVVTWIW